MSTSYTTKAKMSKEKLLIANTFPLLRKIAVLCPLPPFDFYSLRATKVLRLQSWVNKYPERSAMVLVPGLTRVYLSPGAVCPAFTRYLCQRDRFSFLESEAYAGLVEAI